MILRPATFLILGLLVVPQSVLAHSPIPGIGFFLNGMLHPLLVPAHILLIIAVGLFFGQQRLSRIHWALKLSVLAVAMGLVAAWFAPAIAELEMIILLGAAIIGLLIAIFPSLPLFFYLLIGMAAGFMIGLDSAQATLAGKDKLLMLLGSGMGIYFLSLYPLGLSEYCRHKTWQQIAVRVVGSWIAASALMVLALSFAPTNNGKAEKQAQLYGTTYRLT